MRSAIWLLVVAWGVLATVSSVPWFAHAGWRVIEWMRSPRLLAVIGLHAIGLLGPLVAGVGLWRGSRLIACAALVLVSVAWLLWHIVMFTEVAWVVRDSPRVLLSIVTLGVVVAYAIDQARGEVG